MFVIVVDRNWISNPSEVKEKKNMGVFRG